MRDNDDLLKQFEKLLDEMDKHAHNMNNHTNSIGANPGPSSPPTKNSKRFTKPGGSVTKDENADGEIFMTKDGSGVDVVYQWDGYLEAWFDVTANKNGNSKPSSGHMFLGNGVMPAVDIQLEGNISFEDFKGVATFNPLRCECGSEKSGSNRHSTWCPKHTD